MELNLKHGTGYIDDDDLWVLDGWWWWSQVSTPRRGSTSEGITYIVGRPHTIEGALRSGLKDIASIYPMHRYLLGMPRFADDPRDVDHVNRNGLDNRRANLRIPTQTTETPRKSRSQNAANTRSRPGTSTFKGVSFDARTRRWKAQVMIDGRNANLGRYDTEEQAALVYNRAALEAWGEYAQLNDIPAGVTLPTGTRGSSRYRGVTWDASKGRWMAQIAPGGKQRFLGRFATEEEAALAYNVAALEVFGDRARLNSVGR